MVVHKVLKSLTISTRFLYVPVRNGPEDTTKLRNLNDVQVTGRRAVSVKPGSFQVIVPSNQVVQHRKWNSITVRSYNLNIVFHTPFQLEV